MHNNVAISLPLSGASGRMFLLGVTEYIRSRKLEWNLHLYPSLREQDTLAFQELIRGMDGIITDTHGASVSKDGLEVSEIPLVVFGEPVECGLQRKTLLSFIHNQDEKIGSMAAESLMSFGNYQAFAFVHARDVGTWSMRRFNGFAETLRVNGKSCSAYEWNVQSLTEFISKQALPLAVMTACDIHAIDVLATAHRLELQIPRQIAIISVDNDELLCEFSSPSITSIAPDYRQEGATAAHELDMLLKYSRKRHSPKIVSFKDFNLYQRESSSYLAPATSLVNHALSFIREHLTERLSAHDVVTQLGVSRRLLDLRFSQLLGSTVADTILDLRLKEFYRRLKTTSIPFAKLARNCGFDNPTYLKRIFKRHFNMSAEEVRHPF